MSKQEFRGVAGDIGNYRGNLWADFRPQYKEVRGWERDLGTRIGQTGDFYRGMMENPAKRGYDAATRGRMLGTQMDALAGARTNEQNQIRRAIQAAGMGNTGAGIRAGLQTGEKYGSLGRQAARDVELANAEASRSDLWNAAQGLGQTQALQQQGLRDYTAGLGAENQFYASTLFPTFNQQLAAYNQANQPGFWSRLGQGLLGSAIGGLGGGLGSWAAGSLLGGGGSANQSWSTPNPATDAAWWDYAQRTYPTP